MRTWCFGRSRGGLPIHAHSFGHFGKRILILGGVHGDEGEGVIAGLELLERWRQNFSHRLCVDLVPIFNIDGVIAKTRGNGHGIDLNRNLPTRDWSPHVATPRYHPGPYAGSEPENLALINYLAAMPPDFILSLHSWKPLLNVNGAAHAFAQVISSLTGYHLEEDIGYPTPGCLGTYSGLERGIPTLTYEIERGLDSQSILRLHVPAILEACKVLEV